VKVAVKVNNWLTVEDDRQLGCPGIHAPESPTVPARDLGSGFDNRDSGVAATGSAVRDPGIVIEVQEAAASARDPGQDPEVQRSPLVARDSESVSSNIPRQPASRGSRPNPDEGDTVLAV